MKEYEIVKEIYNGCAGDCYRAGCEITEEELADPMAYVQEQEPNLELEKVEEDGVITISGIKNGLWFKYEFTED